MQPFSEKTLLPEVSGIFAVTAAIGFAAGFGTGESGIDEVTFFGGAAEGTLLGTAAEETGLSTSFEETGAVEDGTSATDDGGKMEEGDAAEEIAEDKADEDAAEEAPSDEASEEDSSAGGVVWELHAESANARESRTGMIPFLPMFSSLPRRTNPRNQPD